MSEGAIWYEGELVSPEEAMVPFNSASLHYGLAVFEGIRCYDTDNGPAVFRLEEHLRRFLESARIIMVRDLPYDVEQLRQAVHSLVATNGYTRCYIRPLLFMDDPPKSLNIDDLHPKVGISAWEWGSYLGEEALELGSRMMVSSFSRHHVNVNMTKAKVSGNYANSMMAKTLAVRCGFDEAVMLDPQGYVSECSGENLFVVRDGVVYTPPRSGVLEGITRDAIITLAKDLDFPVVEEQLSRDQLYVAEEVFVCGTAAECTPVREIDFIQIGQGRRGPVTEVIQKTFFDTLRGKGERSEQWLDYVSTRNSLAA